MRRKHRKRNTLRVNPVLRTNFSKITQKEKVFTKQDELFLSATDKVVWVYKITKKFKITEITTVSYVASINGTDYTIIYYDNTHSGVMHSHLRISIQNPSDSPIILSIRKKGNQGKLTNWAIKDIMDKWYYYRKKFYKRSGLRSKF